MGASSSRRDIRSTTREREVAFPIDHAPHMLAEFRSNLQGRRGNHSQHLTNALSQLWLCPMTMGLERLAKRNCNR